LAVEILGAAVVAGFGIVRGGLWVFTGLGAAVSLVFALEAIERRSRGERCRSCGREAAVRRVGRRRTGYARFRCRYCHDEQWGTIPER